MIHVLKNKFTILLLIPHRMKVEETYLGIIPLECHGQDQRLFVSFTPVNGNSAS